MPLFKRRPERSNRIEELEAHVRNIRRIAAEDPKGAGALQSFLIEDGYWERTAVELEAQADPQGRTAHPNQPPSAQPPRSVQPQPHHASPPEARMVTAETVEHVQPRSEEEAILEAELQRYLARIAEESAPDPDDEYPEDEFAQ
jgi:hypothetical protein